MVDIYFMSVKNISLGSGNHPVGDGIPGFQAGGCTTPPTTHRPLRPHAPLKPILIAVY